MGTVLLTMQPPPISAARAAAVAALQPPAPACCGMAPQRGQGMPMPMNPSAQPPQCMHVCQLAPAGRDAKLRWVRPAALRPGGSSPCAEDVMGPVRPASASPLHKPGSAEQQGRQGESVGRFNDWFQWPVTSSEPRVWYGVVCRGVD